MIVVPYWHVDAFADRPFTGNQAAVMVLDDWLEDSVLQAIGQENNFAETAFVVRDASGEADWALRWFTPTTEIRLCGHATLASGHVLLTRDGGESVTFRTREAGILEVRRSGDAYEVGLPAIRTRPHDAAQAVAALGDTPDEIERNEDGYTVYRFASEEQVRALAPDFRALEALGDDLHVVTARGGETDIVSRAFAPAHGIDEDPVTGGAHAMLTPFWAERLERETFTAYQASARGGRLTCRLEGDRVWLGGACVTVVEGQFSLPG